MSPNIVVLRTIIRAAWFYNPGWRHSGQSAFQFRHYHPMNYEVVALLAIAPYLIIVAAALFIG